MKLTNKQLTKSSAAFLPLKYVSEAITNDETRYYLNGVYYLPAINTIVASNGKRLHIAKKVDLSQFIELDESELDDKGGVVLRVKVSAKEISFNGVIDCKFPDYTKIIPAHTQNALVEFKSNDKDIGFSAGYHTISRLISDPINYKYIQSLFNACNEWRIFYGASSSACYFESGDLSAVIMPFCS